MKSQRVWRGIRTSSIALYATITACASTHDLNNGPGLFGGGVNHGQIAPGLYWVVVKTNFKPWSDSSGARRLWRGTARQLCGKSRFDELDPLESKQEVAPRALGLVQYVVTTRAGYALCDSSGLGRAQALILIRDR